MAEQRKFIPEEELNKEAKKVETEKSEWLRVSERYIAEPPWSEARVARDLWQNFFDANNYTLDGIAISIEENTEGTATASIQGNASYDYKRLLSFGSGMKEDYERSAGKYSEGSRIAALHMLRDFGCDSVTFGSEDWELEFYLDTPPEDKVPADQKETRHLYAKQITTEPKEGNFVRFTTKDKQLAEELVKAKDYFRHSENEDFKNPDIETQNGGFKFLGKDEKGFFYLNGQKVAFRNGSLDEPNVPSFTLWSNKTPKTPEGVTIDIGRDRKNITSEELEEIFIPFLVNSMEKEDAKLALELLEPLYAKESSSYYKTTDKKILAHLIEKNASEKAEIEFPANYIADTNNDETLTPLLKKLGYTICEGELSKLGMQKVSDVFERLQQIESKEPTESERERLQVLGEHMEKFFSFCESHPHFRSFIARMPPDRKAELMKGFSQKEIQLYSNDHPFEGIYKEGVVWIKRGAIHNDSFANISTLYLHEVCHMAGPDNSVEFSYALTDIMQLQTEFFLENPEILQQFAAQWKERKIEKETGLDAETLANQILEAIEKARNKTNETQRRYRQEALQTRAEELELVFLAKYEQNPNATQLIELYQEITVHSLVIEWKQLSQNTEEEFKKSTDLRSRMQAAEETHIKIIEEIQNHLEEQNISDSLADKLGRYGIKNLAEKGKIPDYITESLTGKEKRELKRALADVAESIRVARDTYKRAQKLKSEIAELDNGHFKESRLLSEISRLSIDGQTINAYDLEQIGRYTSGALAILFKNYQEGQITAEQLTEDAAAILDFAKENGASEKEMQNIIIDNLQEALPSIVQQDDKAKQEEVSRFAEELYNRLPT